MSTSAIQTASHGPRRVGGDGGLKRWAGWERERGEEASQNREARASDRTGERERIKREKQRKERQKVDRKE